MKRRPGFTLLELLTAMMIVALLAAIATSRFWSVKSRSYRVAIKNDLHALAVQQERYFDRARNYAASTSIVPDFIASPGVTITINWATPQGWAASATHTSLSGEECGYYAGPAPAGSAGPATREGEVTCDE